MSIRNGRKDEPDKRLEYLGIGQSSLASINKSLTVTQDYINS